MSDYIDDEIQDEKAVEVQLRRVLAYARDQSARNRTDHPATGRAWSLIATHIEDALRTLLLPVP